jgi:hypothetical protein
MSFTKIQQDIIKVVFESHDDPKCPHEPCIEGLQATLKHKYSLEEIEGNVLKLISKGVFEPYSFQSHLRFTERFKYMKEYKRLLNSLSYI